MSGSLSTNQESGAGRGDRCCTVHRERAGLAGDGGPRLCSPGGDLRVPGAGPPPWFSCGYLSERVSHDLHTNSLWHGGMPAGPGHAFEALSSSDPQPTEIHLVAGSKRLPLAWP